MSALAPGILIAAPSLTDPNFDRSVVLVASHDEDGAFGWVLNGRRSMSVSELLTRADVVPPPREQSDDTQERLLALPGEVTAGGPVSPDQVWLVYPAAEQLAGVDGQFEVAPGIFATASRSFLEELASGRAVPHLRAFAGYAGWGPGQLEDEIQAGGWLPGEVSADLIFQEATADQIWNLAYRKMGTSPIAFTSRTVGSA